MSDQFFSLRVAQVQREANDTTSLVFDLPGTMKEEFAYRAGQYVTIRVEIDGKRLRRSYSMSTAPETDPHLRITIKRVKDGRVSAWINSTIKVGDVIDVMPPAGGFVLRDRTVPVVLLGGGSGITPLISLAKSALATTQRQITLVYANRDQASVIFAAELEALAKANPARLKVIHWLDAERGLVDKNGLRDLGVLDAGADHYICGPEAFMQIAEAAALENGADRDHIFIERFVSLPDEDVVAQAVPATSDAEAPSPCETVTITLGGKTRTVPYQAGRVLIEIAAMSGFRPAYSCLAGQCGNCMAKLKSGTVTMRANYALTSGEVEAGSILTCQSIPTSKEVEIDYGY
jgi:3-ketosteroid 9alpha-monooxygenase subunit B